MRRMISVLTKTHRTETRLMKAILVFGVFVFFTASFTIAQDGEEAAFKEVELPPVKRIVLYNSGVGQLQHEGKIEGKGQVSLRFGSHDVSDALKSLAIADDNGGNVRSIEYQPAPDPEILAANDIGQPMTIAQLLQVMRGEAIVLSKGDSEIKGDIFGVENRTEGDVTSEMIVVVTEKGLSSHKLTDFDSIKFAKPKLNEKLALALRGIVKSRKSDQKELRLLFDGEGERNIKFAYVIDMPIWRMTYRLLWEKDKAYLQGWAHVDNVSGVDWSDVALELRSGKPSTFHTNVFAPKMAQREDIGTSAYDFMDGMNVVTQWFGFAPAARFEYDEEESFGGNFGGGGFGGGGFGGGLGGGLGGGGFGGGGRGRAFGRAQNGQGKASSGVDAKSGFKISADTEKVSQMVVYRISEPVSLDAGTSAALPAFEVELPGELMSVVDLAVLSGEVIPVQAIELENNTEFSLLSGPISIMRKGSFAGDGKLPRVDVKQKVYVDFGIDRPLRVKQLATKTKSDLLDVTIEGRNIARKWKTYRTETYRVVNLDVEDRTVLIKTERESVVESIEPKPYRTTDDRLMHKVKALAGETKEYKFVFTNERVDRRIWTDSRSVDTKLWDKLGITPADEDLALPRQIAEINSTVDKLTKQTLELRKKRKLAETEQSRIRENLKVFVPGSEDAEPIIAQFVKIENGIGETDESIKTNLATIEELNAEKKELLKSIKDPQQQEEGK